MSKPGMKPQQAAKLREAQGLTMSKLQRQRVEKGMSQSELSAVTGISLRQIQHYEQGSRLIDSARLDTICSLCRGLGCKIEDVLENEDLIESLKMVK